MQIVIVSGYRFDYDKSIKNIICSSLSDIGYQYQYINYNKNEKEKSLDTIGKITKEQSDCVILICVPKNIPDIIKNIQNNNIILWNQESISKTAEYKNIINNAATNNNVKNIWLYNECQFSYIKSKKAKFVPMGFHGNLCVSKNKKIIFNKLLFIGGIRENRRKYFNKLNEHDIAIDCSDDYRLGPGDKLEQYQFGIDVDEYPEQSEKYRWHRLMLYASNNIIFFSTTNWEKYGFVNGSHYINFKNISELKTKYLRLREREHIVNNIVCNMSEKVRKDYNMSDILKYNLLNL